MSFFNELNNIIGFRDAKPSTSMIVGGAIGCALGVYFSYENQQNEINSDIKRFGDKYYRDINNTDLFTNAIFYGTVGTLFGTVPNVTGPLFAVTAGSALLFNIKNKITTKSNTGLMQMLQNTPNK